MTNRGQAFVSFLIGLSVIFLTAITTDQIWQSVYDSSNTALRVNLVSGGSSGSVTSVGLTMPAVFSVANSPITTSGTLAVTANGTSGGIPYFNAATTMASSAALTANTLIKGGGAGASPAVSAITDDGSGALGFYPASATPQAVTATFASGSGTNIAGAATVIKLSGSTGSGLGGTLSIQNTNLAGTGSAANTYGNVLRLSPPNSGTTAPVNYFDIKNSITGGNIVLSAVGTDTNIGVDISSKGTAFVNFRDSSGAVVFRSGSTNGNAVFYGATSSSMGFANGEPGTADALWSRDAAASIQMGLDAASPTAQTYKGADTTTNGNAGGDFTILGGAGLTSGAGGILTLGGGTSGNAGLGGALVLRGGTSTGTDKAGAAVTIAGGVSTGAGLGGTITVTNTNLAGTGSSANTPGNVLTLSPPNSGTTAPVNYVDIKNAITTVGPTIASTGSDSNVNLNLTAKGTGVVAVGDDFSYSGKLTIAGVDAENASFTIDNRIEYITTGASAIIATTPASPTVGDTYTLIKEDSGAGTVVWTRAGSQLLNGATTRTISVQYGTDTCVYAASNVWICQGSGV